MFRGIIISDTHSGTIEKLGDGLISEIKTADFVVHAGDADETNFMSELKAISKVLYAVRGNCDCGSCLPEKLVFKIENVKIGLSHGAGRHDNVIERLGYIFHEDDVNLIIFGHTHFPLSKDINGIWFLNPGSVSKNRGWPYQTYARLEVDKEKFNISIEKVG